MNIEAITQDKTDKDLWERVALHARANLPLRDITDAELEKILIASKTPEQFQILFTYLFKYGKSNANGAEAIKSFFRFVDSSSFNLEEWIQGIEVFHSWLLNEKRETDFIKMIGYLQCSDFSPENRDINQNFSDLIRDMLETHGYVG